MNSKEIINAYSQLTKKPIEIDVSSSMCYLKIGSIQIFMVSTKSVEYERQRELFDETIRQHPEFIKTVKEYQVRNAISFYNWGKKRYKLNYEFNPQSIESIFDKFICFLHVYENHLLLISAVQQDMIYVISRKIDFVIRQICEQSTLIICWNTELKFNHICPIQEDFGKQTIRQVISKKYDIVFNQSKTSYAINWKETIPVMCIEEAVIEMICLKDIYQDRYTNKKLKIMI